MSELKNRIDFVYIFDVQDGNPNGDPDAGNLPRVDADDSYSIDEMINDIESTIRDFQANAEQNSVK